MPSRESLSTLHLLGQLHERPPRRLYAPRPATPVRWLPRVARSCTQLNARDDQLAIGVAQPRERRLVALEGFVRPPPAPAARGHRPRAVSPAPLPPAAAPTRRMWSRIRFITAWRRYACRAPSPRASIVSRCLNVWSHRFLDNVLGVGQVSGPRRQPSAGPAQERRPAPGEERVERRHGRRRAPARSASTWSPRLARDEEGVPSTVRLVPNATRKPWARRSLSASASSRRIPL